MYDTKCEDLAKAFLADTCSADDKSAIAALAQEIQDKIEEWIEFDLPRMECAQ